MDLCDARTPDDQESRRERCDVSEESLRGDIRWCSMKIFGRDYKEQTMQHISSRKLIATSGLRDLKITVND